MQELQLSHNDLLTMLQAEIAAASGTARSLWWDIHSDAPQKAVKRVKLYWKFSDNYSHFPDDDGYDPVTMLPNTYQRWSDLEIHKCIKALQSRALEADACDSGHNADLIFGKTSSDPVNSLMNFGATTPDIPHRSARPVTSEAADSLASNHNKGMTVPRHYQRLMKRLKDLFKNATGSTFSARQNTSLLCDKLSGPGAYRWNFSEHFSCFPSGAPSSWTSAECHKTEQALDSHWVSITPLVDKKYTNSPQIYRGSSFHRFNPPTQGGFSGFLPPTIFTDQASDERQRVCQSPMEIGVPIATIIASIKRDISSAYENMVEETNVSLRSSASAYRSAIFSGYDRIAAEFATQRARDQAEISSLRLRIAAQPRGTNQLREAELEQARAEGRATGQEKAIRDIGDLQSVQFKNYIQELKLARRVARTEGYEAGFRAGLDQRRDQEMSCSEKDGNRRSVSLPSEAKDSAAKEKAGYLCSGPQQLTTPRLPIHTGITGGGGSIPSVVKHRYDDDGAHYDDADPLPATKMRKLEHTENKYLEQKPQEMSEDGLILSLASCEESDEAVRGGLFITSDEDSNGGEGEEGAHEDREYLYSYF